MYGMLLYLLHSDELLKSSVVQIEHVVVALLERWGCSLRHCHATLLDFVGDLGRGGSSLHFGGFILGLLFLDISLAKVAF